MTDCKNEGNKLQTKQKNPEETTRIFCSGRNSPPSGRYTRYAPQFRRSLVAQTPYRHQPLFAAGKWGLFGGMVGCFGGKRRGKRGRGASGKMVAFGILKRGGKVDSVLADNAKKEGLLSVIEEKITPDTVLMPQFKPL